jgi:hypothetical protein
LYLQLRRGGAPIGTATGFVVEREAQRFLVTNRHVVRGVRDPITGVIDAPEALGIWHNKAGSLGVWVEREESLYGKAGHPLWFAHPVQPQDVDVAVLPLTQTAGIDVYPYNPWSPGPDLAARPSEPLSIIGFPFGVTGGGALGVWVRGFVATEPDIDWQGLPCFLIDSRTRQGQSGSPVIVFAPGGMVPMAKGGTAMFGGPVERFVGVYSGRINAESDLGFVWKARVVCEIIEAEQRAVP